MALPVKKPNKKISDMTSVFNVIGDEQIPMIREGQNIIATIDLVAELFKGLFTTSTTEGEPDGSNRVLNIVSLTQAEYDAGTPVSTTMYVIIN